MSQYGKQTDLEQTLTERLATLPIPLRIQHHHQHGNWYQWDTLLGNGECGTFAVAVVQALTYQHTQLKHQEYLPAQQPASGESVSTLGACLKQTHRVRPTPVLALYLGVQSWLNSLDAYDLVVTRRGIELSWDAYLEHGQGSDAAGIYVFAPGGQAYRGFDVEG